MKVETIMSADLSGIENASGHPVKWSMMVRVCLFPDVNVSHSVIRLLQFCQKVCWESLSSAEGNVEF